MKKVHYNTEKFNFAKILCDIFQVQDLSNINDNVGVFERKNDQSTPWHKKYYDWAHTEDFSKLYDGFILEVVKPIYNEEIVYQAIPTFRVAYPKNIAVGEWHKDKWYRDVEWAEKTREDNFYLPFTEAFDSNTIWVESKEDLADYSPMNCSYGDLVMWDGSNLTHGNKINETGKTRVSVDFRVMKFSNYLPSDHGSINTNTKFQIGGYYKKM